MASHNPIPSSSNLVPRSATSRTLPPRPASSTSSPSSSSSSSRRPSLASPSRRPLPLSSSPRSDAPLRLNSLSLILAFLSFASISSIVQAATFEPPGNQVLFGAWIDSQAGFSDTPSKFNSRLGQNVPVFQIAQDIPLPPYNYTTGAGGAALENLIELSETDAAVFLTVYPAKGFDAVSNDDYTALGKQIYDYQANLNRTVFLRYAPEMQGTWNLYGQQPTAFNTSWHAMWNAVKQEAPATLFVWAPNTPQGYPYGESFAATTTWPYTTSAADQLLLDTNGNGRLDAGDDAFSPYYPGDDVVDWVGISLYYKGLNSDVTNADQPQGYCAAAINGTNPADGTVVTPWYHDYCELKPEMGCMFSESGAAYHIGDTGAASQVAIQTSWINDCIANSTFLDQFPRLKLIMQFEFEKVESSNAGTQDLRDYRITNDSDVLNVFIQALAQPDVATRFSWANFRAAPTSISSAGAPAATNSQGSTIIEAITQTTRARPTGFPKLFGLSSSGSQTAEIVELGVLVVSGIAGAWAVMRMV